MNQTRLLRLQNDYEQLKNIDDISPYISIRGERGNPPTKYEIIYRIPGYVNSSGDIRDEHRVELNLPHDYPFSAPPKFRFLDSLWHPNVFVGGDVCLGLTADNWRVGYELDQLVYDVGNIVLFDPISINLGSLARGTLTEWNAWINSHRAPLLDVDFNVRDKPIIVLRHTSTSSKKEDSRLSPPNTGPIKVTIKPSKQREISKKIKIVINK